MTKTTKRTRITMSMIKTATDEELRKIIDILGSRAFNTFNACRDKEMIWYRPDFQSIERRFNLATKILYGKDCYLEHAGDFGNCLC